MITLDAALERSRSAVAASPATAEPLAEAPLPPPRLAPPVLPLAGRLEQFGMTTKLVCAGADAPGPDCDGGPSPSCRGPWDLGFFNPVMGRLLGPRLAARVGGLLHRPFCSFVNSFMWHSGNGSSQSAHRDRPTLDITVGLPLLLEGAPQWPLYLERLDGRLWQYPSRPGSMLVMDGRQRTHWRNPFAGTRAVALLLHYRAPVVLWRGLVTQRICGQLAVAEAPGSHRAMADVLEGGLALAQRAVPVSTSPTATCSGPGQALSGETSRKEGAAFLVPLTGEAKLTIAGFGTLPLQPGDGVTFLPKTKYRLEWPPGALGCALEGRTGCPRDWNNHRQPAAEAGAAEVPLLDDVA